MNKIMKQFCRLILTAALIFIVRADLVYADNVLYLVTDGAKTVTFTESGTMKGITQSEFPAKALSKYEILANGKAITDSTEITSDTTLTLNYYLKNLRVRQDNYTENVASLGETFAIRAGDVFYFDGLPSNCIATGASSTTVTLDGVTIGTAEIVSSGENAGKIKLTIDSGFEFPSVNSEKLFTDSMFGFNLKIDATQIGSDGSFDFGGGIVSGTTKVKVTDYQPEYPTVTKSGTYDDSTGKINWTVTIKNPNNIASDYTASDIYLVDSVTAQSTYLKAASDFKINETDKSSSLTSSTASGYTIDLTSATSDTTTGGKTLTITYSTEVDWSAYMTSGATLPSDGKLKIEDVTNEVQLCHDDGSGNKTVITGTDSSGNAVTLQNSGKTTASRDLTGTVSCVKTGATPTIQGDGSANVEWTITLTVTGYTIKDVHVFDYFKTSGTDYDRMSYVSTGTMTPTPTVTQNGTDSRTGDAYAVCWTFSPLSPGTYTIKYTTNIPDYVNYTHSNSNSQITNKVWADYTLDVGSEIGPVPYAGLTYKYDKLTTNVATKTYDSYDASTGTITWKITLNPNKVELKNLVITEEIQDKQEWVSGQTVNISIDGAARVDITTLAGTSIDATTDSSNVKITLGDNLNGKQGEIYVKTHITDEDILISNSSITLSNKAKITSDNLSPDVEVSASTNKKPTSKMITKSKSAEYNYADHTITYKIVVNENKQLMNYNPIVTDELASYLTMDTSSLTIVQGSSTDIKSASTVSAPSGKGGTLKITLPKMDNSAYVGTTDAVYTITYKVTVDEDYLNTEGLNSTGTTTVTNKAELYVGTKKYADSTDTTSINNKSATKTVTPSTSEYAATYTITINQAQTQLKAGSVLTDTLPTAMTLDESSFSIKKVNVNSSTGAMTDGATLTKGSDYTLSVSGGKLIITFPNATTNCMKISYKLKYQGDYESLSDDFSFNNSFTLNGFSATNSVANNASFDKSAWSTVKTSNILYVAILKKDKTGDTPLAGATFTLYSGATADTATELISIDSGSDGYAYFGNLSSTDTYWVAETKAPTGYKISDTSKVKVTPSKGKTAAKTSAVTFLDEVAPKSSESSSSSSDDSSSSSSGSSGGSTTTVVVTPTPTPSVPMLVVNVVTKGLTPYTPITETETPEGVKITGTSEEGYPILKFNNTPEGWSTVAKDDTYDWVIGSNGCVLGVRRGRNIATGDTARIVPLTVSLIVLIALFISVSIVIRRKSAKLKRSPGTGVTDHFYVNHR